MKTNRLIFFVGVNTGYATREIIEERFIDFYRRRSSPALHCAIVGNVLIPGGHGTNCNTPEISYRPEWRELASEISLRGSLPGVQLATVWEGYVGSRNFVSASGPGIIGRSRHIVREMGQHKIRSTLKSLEIAADIAVEAGFCHLQVHAAHGYLLSLLVDERINHDAPEFLDRLGEWSQRYTSAGIETSIRFSLKTGDHKFDAHGQGRFHAQIAKLPFDFIDVSSGFYDINKQLIYPARPDVLRARRADTTALARRFPERQFIFSGKAMNQTDHDLPDNLHLGICRDLIANPSFLADQQDGCANSGKCHYYSRGKTHITCARWSVKDEDS